MIGQIILVSSCFEADRAGGNDLLEGVQPVFAIVEKAWSTGGKEDWLEVTWLEPCPMDPLVDSLHVGYDDFELVPEEDVPDRIWAALALQRMTGEVT